MGQNYTEQRWICGRSGKYTLIERIYILSFCRFSFCEEDDKKQIYLLFFSHCVMLFLLLCFSSLILLSNKKNFLLIFSRCIFAELKQKSELFRAGTEAEIIDLIFRLLGTPQGSLLEQYKTYPDWEKLNYTKVHPCRLTAEFGRLFDNLGLSLLERLLDLNPSTRITAKDALEHRYFSPDTLLDPSR